MLLETLNTKKDGLRFRIQQVGLTTLNSKGNLPNFAEMYNFDLMASEAKYQKDKVFADAIFALDKKYYLKGKISTAEPRHKKTIKPNENNSDSELNKHDILEDKDFDYKQILKMNFRDKKEDSPSEEIPKVNLIDENEKNSFRNFIQYYSVQPLKNIENIK